MPRSETHAPFGKLATWWRRWRTRNTAAADFASACCCATDAAERPARVANGPMPQVLPGKWPVDRGLQRFDRMGAVDKT
jgi:hypothetical protein